MKFTHALLTAAAALLLVGSAIAGEEREEKIELKIMGGDELAVDVSDLEEGEAREFYTESGKKVVITKTAEGHVIDVDGKEINLGQFGGGDHGEHNTFIHSHSGDGDAHAKVIVKHLDSEASGFHFINADGEDVEIDIDSVTDFEWNSEDGANPMVIVTGNRAAERLKASGVLDDLSEEKRQEILDALGAGGEEIKVEKRVVLIHRDEHENDGDNDHDDDVN